MSTLDSNGRGWTLALTSVAFFMVALNALVVATALPVMGRDLHAGMPALQWTVNALTYAAGIITAAAPAPCTVRAASSHPPPVRPRSRPRPA